MAKAKTIMREFALDEISAVVKPAQKGARMVIMKRDGGEGTGTQKGGEGGGGDRMTFTKEQIAEMIAKGCAVITGETDGHTHLILMDDYVCMRGGGFTEYGDVDHRHPFTLDEDSGTITIGVARGHTHTAPPVVMKTDDTTDIGKDLGMTPEQMAELLALAGMNDVQKSHYGKLDAAGKAEFAKMDHAGREAAIAAEVAKAKGGVEGAGGDAVLYTMADGRAVRKSDGELAAVLAKSVDTLTKALTVTKEEALEKEAEALAKSWTHIGQEFAEKLKLAKGILELPAEPRKAALAGINAGKDAMAPVFKTFGALGGANDLVKAGPTAKLDELAKAHAAKTGQGFHKAYADVIMTPEGMALYEEFVQPVTQH